MPSDRIIGLDVVRATAITMVLIFHSFPILKPLATIPGPGQVIHKFLSLSEPLGLLGVELFFVLSGFLIGSIMLKIFFGSNKYGFTDIKNFLVRRWFRTLPNYWLVLIANIILYSGFGAGIAGINWVRYFFFTQNLQSPNPHFFPESWSLAIEEWFYLTLPLTIYLLYAIFKKSGKRQIVLFTFCIYAIIPLTLRLLNASQSVDPLYFDSNIRKVVIFRLDAISYGMIMAYLVMFYKEHIFHIKKLLLWICIVGIIALTAIHFAGIFPSLGFYARYSAFRVFINSFLLTLIPVFFALCLPAALGLTRLRSKRFAAIITFISKISYSIYLIHFSLLYVPFFDFRTYTIFNCVPWFLLYLAVVILLSWLLYRFFEFPVMNLRKKISHSDPII